MSTELTITHTTTAAGLVANGIASRHVFADYQQRKSTNSLRAQYADLATFASYLADAGIAAPSADELQNQPTVWAGLTWGLVAGFVQWMLAQGLALASINRKLSTVKTYAGLAAKAEIIPAADLTLIKAVQGYAAKEFKRVDEKRTEAGQAVRVGSKKAKGVVLTQEQAKALKSQPATPQGRRDALIMALLLDHGLRVGELARLQVTDVDLASGELRFYRPKVAKVQTHRLSRDAKAALKAYAPYAPAMGPILRGSRKGGKLDGYGMTEWSITMRVGELGRTLEIEGLSAHDCRHYWATRAIRRGADPFAVLQAGGWTSMATVQKYVDETTIANEGIPGDA